MGQQKLNTTIGNRLKGKKEQVNLSDSTVVNGGRADRLTGGGCDAL